MSRVIVHIIAVCVLASCASQTVNTPLTYSDIEFKLGEYLTDGWSHSYYKADPPLIWEYEDSSREYYTPHYPQQIKEAFHIYLQEQVNAGKNPKDAYEQFSFANETLLMMAAYTNDMALAEFLIGQKVDVNQRAYEEKERTPIVGFGSHVAETALHYAARAGNKQMYDFLVQHGADKNIRNKNNKKPMEVWNKRRF